MITRDPSLRPPTPERLFGGGYAPANGDWIERADGSGTYRYARIGGVVHLCRSMTEPLDGSQVIQMLRDTGRATNDGHRTWHILAETGTDDPTMASRILDDYCSRASAGEFRSFCSTRPHRPGCRTVNALP